MKRSLAIIAMLAMVVSMFSGVTFAYQVGDTEVYVQVDNNILHFGKGFNYVELSGKIFNSDSNALEKIDAEINIYKGSVDPANLVETVTADNGTFSVSILTDTADTGIGNYLVVGTDLDGSYVFAVGNDDDTISAQESADARDTFSIIYETELAQPTTLEFNYPLSGQVVVQGSFVNEDASDSDVIAIAYKDEFDAGNVATTSIATASFNDSDSFGFLFNGSAFDKVGEIAIYINGVIAVEGKVNAGALDASLVTDEVVRALGDQEITLSLNLADDYLNSTKDDLGANYTVRYSVKDTDGNYVLDNSDAEVKEVDITNIDFDKNEAKVTLECNDWEAGDYTLVVELYNTNQSTVVKEVELDLEVVVPSKYNLVDWSLDEINVGSNDFVFADEINVKVYTSGSATRNQFVEVVYEGAGLDKTTVKSNLFDDGNANFDLKPTQTGTITMTINVYTDKDDTEADHSFTKEIKVVGWNVVVTPNEAMVDVETEFTVTITDEEGNPVNNAIVKANDVTVVDGTSDNIVGGIYTFDKEFDTVGNVKIEVFKNGAGAQVTLNDGIRVKGEEVYTVTTDTPVLLNGIEQDIYVTVLDENGDIVYPTFVREDIALVDGEDDTEDGTIDAVGSRKDLDGDGIKEAVKLTVVPTVDQHTMVIRATTDSDKKMGEVQIDVQKPLVVYTKGEKLTENFESEFEFTVVDPRDDSVMDVDLDLEAKYLAGGSVDTVTDKDLQADEDNVWTMTALVKDINWETAEEDEETVEAKIMMDTVELTTIEVVKPSLTANPESVIINAPTNVTLTYVDGNGNALEGYAITLDGEEVGTTDENGQVVYATSSTSSLALKFEAATDVDGEVTELTVKSAADTEGPVVEAPETVTEGSAVITIKDNVRVSKVMVNGTPVDIYFPKAEVAHIVNLQMGDNTFTVEAIDINNNYTKQVVVIERVADTNVVEFQIGVATEYGTPALIEGTTMVPVRFAEDLGATIAWDNTTKTATYTLGEKSISVTIGSKTAVVNGENVQVTQTPFINSQNRTMVPLRMIAQELGFNVHWVSNSQPVKIMK